MLRSPAAAVFSRSWFEEQGVPVIGHQAQILEGEWPLSGKHPQVRGQMKIRWDGGELSPSYEGVAPFRSQPVFLQMREYVYSNPAQVVLKDSILGALFTLAEDLTERFPWWHVTYMPMFVLMGRAPVDGFYPDEGISPHSLPYEPITMQVPPWFSVEDVSRRYKIIARPTTPLPSARRLALFEFVMKHPEVSVPGERQRPIVRGWRGLMRSWNEQYPEGHQWHYKEVYSYGKPDHRNCQRHFDETFEQIVNYSR